eukprot:6584592-Prymnesium_polylepis.1
MADVVAKGGIGRLRVPRGALLDLLKIETCAKTLQNHGACVSRFFLCFKKMQEQCGAKNYARSAREAGSQSQRASHPSPKNQPSISL